MKFKAGELVRYLNRSCTYTVLHDSYAIHTYCKNADGVYWFQTTHLTLEKNVIVHELLKDL